MMSSTSSARDIERAIFEELRKSAASGQLGVELHAVVDDVRDTWLGIWDSEGPHPDQTGSYRASIEAHKTPIRLRRRGTSEVGDVSSDDDQAGFVEYGTGGASPTPEFAPARRTAAEYHS
jgi:hypothetical protein